MSWMLVQIDTQMHLTPIDDLRPHDESQACWCCPEECGLVEDLFIHKSLDGREPYESGERGLQ